MKSMIVKGLSFICILSFVIACNAKQEEPVAIDKEAIKKEIQAKEDSFAAVYNSGEVRNIGYYADDAVSYFQNREPLVGKASIIAFLKNDVHSAADKISFQSKECFIANDGMQVLEIGAFKVVDSAGSTLNSGHYMTLFEKRNGKYVAVRDMSASDMTN